MPLAPLAAVEDLPDGTTGDTATALAVASAAIRDAAGVPISQVADATVTTNVNPGSRLLPLPGPLVSVSSVEIDGTAVTEFIVDGNAVYRACGWGYHPYQATVVCTFGLAEVPADIVDLTVDLALAWLAHKAEGGGSTAGLKSVRLDDAAETYDDEHAGQVSPVYIPEKTRQWLANRFGGGGVTVVHTL
ncbi:MAG TPA: hypothetical protein VJL80_09715 [Aeromicrobium sp.]|nr:hypothetical protein [Aeromicrobium sp.]HKY58302.1 hypothetical protein [Aeromicrobium sp.]